jgi:hypothetical protein
LLDCLEHSFGVFLYFKAAVGIPSCTVTQQPLHALKLTYVLPMTAGNTYGVAKNVTLHAVRVLDCAGRAMVSSMLKVWG